MADIVQDVCFSIKWLQSKPEHENRRCVDYKINELQKNNVYLKHLLHQFDSYNKSSRTKNQNLFNVYFNTNQIFVSIYNVKCKRQQIERIVQKPKNQTSTNRNANRNCYCSRTRIIYLLQPISTNFLCIKERNYEVQLSE